MKNKEIAEREVILSNFIPYTSQVGDRIVKTRDGAYLTTWQLEGIPFETTDEIDLINRHDSLNQLLRGLKGKVSIWSHRIRRKVADELEINYEQEFVKDMAEKYYQSFTDSKMMTTDMFFTLVYKPNSAIPENPFLRLFSGQALRKKDEIINQDIEAIKTLEELIKLIDSALKKFNIIPLNTYLDQNGNLCSMQLEFYGYLINGQFQKVAIMDSSIHKYLATSRLFFGSEKLEIRTAESSIYGAILDLQDYPSMTRCGILNGLLYSEFEYIETQSFSLLDRPSAKEALEVQRNQLISAEDAAGSQIDALDLAIEQLIDGQFVLGEYHYSLVVFGENPEKATKNLADARTILNEAGFLASSVDLVADAAWFAQLPGNWKYRPRSAKLTSRNFLGLSSFHNFEIGKRDNNPWGESVTILKTPNGSPYYFNWHSSPKDENSFDKKTPANTTIIGMTGSGKTVLELFLLLMSLKYKPTIVFFDKDRGAEIAIRALGGNYRCFKRGVPTGLNPFQLANTEGNILFLVELVKSLIPRELEIGEEKLLDNSIRQLLEFENKSQRRLAILAQMVQPLKENLLKWSQGSQLAWVLDNPEDTVDLSKGYFFGFDDTDFLDSPEILAPVTMYLMHLTNNLIDGRRFIYVMAEFWKRLQLPVFAEFAGNKQYTIRKQNGFGIFDTQSPAQILGTPYVAALVEQSATQIFLPNPKADYDDYVKGFKLTESEYQKIKTLGETSRQFLIKQDGRSSVVYLDLEGMNEVLDILSTTSDNVELLDEIRLVYGDNPKEWLPIFKQRLEKKRSMKLN